MAIKKDNPEKAGNIWQGRYTERTYHCIIMHIFKKKQKTKAKHNKTQ
jgi:hypothetical protein